MGKAWVSQVEGGKAGKPEGVFATQSPSARVATVDPMEDWDKVMHAGAGGRWQPVYVRLVAKDGATAAKVATQLLAGLPEVRLSSECLGVLNRLVSAPGGFAKDDPGLSFFVYRPARCAYDDVTGGSALLCKVLAVGPAIPEAVVESLVRPREYNLPLERADLPPQPLPCITAIVDDQIGFLNERFRRPQAGKKRGVTRILRLALMGQPAVAGSSGAVVVNPAPPNIDQLIADHPWEESAYAEAFPLGVRGRPTTKMEDPGFRRPWGFREGHGTHVLDLAAGFPMEKAPSNRPIFAVQLPRLAAAETWGARLDLFVLLAVIRILDWADTCYSSGGKAVPLPVVINISYGVLAGAKDGTGFLEAEIAKRLAWRSRKVATHAGLPAGNGYRARTHARLSAPPKGKASVTLRLQPEDLSPSFVEIWTDKGTGLTLTLTPPQGSPATFRLAGDPEVRDWQVEGQTVVRAYLQARGPRERRRLVLAFAPTLNHDRPELTAPSGAWRIEVENLGTVAALATVDVQRDDTPSTFPAYGRQAMLDDPEAWEMDPETRNCERPGATSAVSRAGTLSALATSTDPNLVVVGGAFDRNEAGRAALYSASGKELDKWPDLAAVSEETRAHPGRLAAGMFSGATSVFSGTSMAAPLVTRALVDWISGGGNLKGFLRQFAGGARDSRLGRSVLPMVQGPGRPARRMGP